MSCIKTKEWLQKLLNDKGWKPEDLEEELHLSQDSIQPILDGATFGKIEVWDRVIQRYDDVLQSMDSGRVIGQLMDELETHSEDSECIVYYQIKNDTIFFIDYLMDEDLSFCKDLPEMCELLHTKMTLTEALDTFQFQNYCRERPNYCLHVEYSDGKVKDETDFTDDDDFSQSVAAVRSLYLKPEPFVRSFKAFIDHKCIEDSETTDYQVIRDDSGEILAIGLNSKK